MTVQRGFAERWAALDGVGGAEVRLAPTVDDAVGMVRELTTGLQAADRVRVLVTGSLHLVGAMLGTLEDVDAL